MPDLLIELLSEEIPARMQGRARDDLKKLVTDGLVGAGLTYAGAHALSTPRRLTLAIEGLSAESRSQREERKGPATTAPEAALQGFLRSTGLTLDELEKRDDKKGQVWFAVIEKPGRKAPGIVAEVLEAMIRNFPWPKSMRWGAGTLRWVRPLHSILCLLTDEHGAEVVPLSIDGIEASNTTRGHRFLAPAAFTVTSFDDYASKLKRAFVMLDPEERARHIWNDAQNAAFAARLELVEDKPLLTEIAGLVECPVVLMGRIGEAFLGLPPEVLQTSMREHQKFFSVKNPRSGQIEGFITVANSETADHGATILKGNQKVLSARLSDAKFFWENDLRIAKAGMGEWLDGLKSVTFHNKLGSQGDRVARIEALAREIAPLVGADPDQAARAAHISKADLRSAMVGEFPELQGTMGRYYALEAGEPAAVADAARDHWRPKGEADSVPTEPVSVAVALADKIDTLTGFWAIDEKPTGSKDPFALRRAALGVIRLVLGNGVRLGLTDAIFGSVLVHYWTTINSARSPRNIVFDVEKEGINAGDLTSADSFASKIGPLNAYFFANDSMTRAFNDLWVCAEPNWLEDDAKWHFEDAVTSVAAGSFDFEGRDIQSERREVADFARRYLEIHEFFDEDRGVSWDQSSGATTSEFFAFNSSLELGPLHPCLSEHREHWRSSLLAFFHDRLKVYLRDQGIRHDVIDACLAMPGNDDLTLLVKRAEALAAFLKTDDGTNLLQGFKRANNILTQAEEKDGVEYSFGADPKFAETDEESALFAALDRAEAAIAPAMAAEDFATAMSAMSALRAPIDGFFTAVQVNSDNEIVRRNRLNLLHRIRQICLSVADLTKLEG